MTLLQMSMYGAALILVTVLIRFLGIHRLPKKTFVVLWCVVMVRLLIPFSIPLPVSMDILPGPAGQVATGTAAAVTDTLPPTTLLRPATVDTGGVNVTTPSLPYQQPAAATASISPVALAMAVWIIGMVGMTLFFVITHLRCRREYRAALPIENDYINQWLQDNTTWRSIQIRQSDRINTPMTYGILRPVILFPKHTNWQDKAGLKYVLAHELTHIKRLDIFIKWLFAASVCIHWFNPLVWVMYVLANRDLEVACDEAVVWTFGTKAKSAYALTLLGLEEKKGGFAPLHNYFAKNAIKERINAIMRLKKSSFAGVALACVLVLVLTACTFVAFAEDTEEYVADYDYGYYVIDDVDVPEESAEVDDDITQTYYDPTQQATNERIAEELVRLEQEEHARAMREIMRNQLEAELAALHEMQLGRHISVDGVQSPYRIATTLEEVWAILDEGFIPVTNVDVPEIRSGQVNGILVTDQCLHEALEVMTAAYAQFGYATANLVTPHILFSLPTHEDAMRHLDIQRELHLLSLTPEEQAEFLREEERRASYMEILWDILDAAQEAELHYGGLYPEEFDRIKDEARRIYDTYGDAGWSAALALEAAQRLFGE